MKLAFRRVMLFAKSPKVLAEFYLRAFGLEIIEAKESFIDLGSGSFRIAFHKAARSSPGNHKLCFFAEDIDGAVRHLALSGAAMGKPRGRSGELWFCDGKDPEGNLFQVSNRS